ncbi:probable cytochrome P450 12a5, mitochondrial [Uloborus diversus]|uniref:probable cytochrome P450 12a5, mitochondrial n=1 Tax=Uloborus diversus TaxID=327109 RepID=UPI0024090228|nr:probable cytochrome P450 12a5, mitochondrial [Uloborus diversus]
MALSFHDMTTSHSVGFLLYQLAKNQEKQEILYQEIDYLLPSKESKITPEVFTQLRYVKGCLKESQRLFPIIPGVARKLMKEVVIAGYRIPAGTIVIVNNREICRQEKYFKNALAFEPERWLDREPLVHRFSFLPFGYGVRSCMGRRLAELEIICLTTEIIRQFKVEYHHEDIDILTRLINTPDKPLKFKFTSRH